MKLKIIDTSKKGKDNKPLEINNSKDGIERYKISNGKYYEANEPYINTESSLEIKEKKYLSNEYIKSGIGKQDNNNLNEINELDLSTEEGWKKAGEKYAESLKPVVNFGNAIGKVKEIEDAIEYFEKPQEEKKTFLGEANVELEKLKDSNNKEIHTKDYKDTIYYNPIENIDNTRNKMLRGDLAEDYTSLKGIGKTINSKLFNNDKGWRDTPQDLTELNLANENNMYTSKPGHTILAKEETKNAINNNRFFDNDIEKYRNEQTEKYSNDIKSFERNITTYKNDNNEKDSSYGYNHLTPKDEVTSFSPYILNDAQARTINILKNKNTFNKQIGYIYVKPFYNGKNNNFECFEIPFEFTADISEGNVSAKYQAENLLNRIGAMQVFTGTDPSTLTLTTSYMALAPDDFKSEEVSRQFSTNSWEYYWTNNRIEEIELKYRSLAFPSVLGNNDCLIKPPIIQVKLINPGKETNDNVGYLLKYPYSGEGSLDKYFKISPEDVYKKYIVTSVQIEKFGNSEALEIPSLYKYSKYQIPGTEEDGINSHITVHDGDTVYSNNIRKKGFKVTLQCTEVSENFLDIVPDYEAYYNAWKNMGALADNTMKETNLATGELDFDDREKLISELSASANELNLEIGGLEKRADKLLSNAYSAGELFCFPEKKKNVYKYFLTLLMLNYQYNYIDFFKDVILKDAHEAYDKIIMDHINSFKFTNGITIDKPKILCLNEPQNDIVSNKIEFKDKKHINIFSCSTNFLYSSTPFEGFSESIKLDNMNKYLKLFPVISYNEKNGQEYIIYKGIKFERNDPKVFTSEDGKSKLIINLGKENEKIIDIIIDYNNFCFTEETYIYIREPRNDLYYQFKYNRSYNFFENILEGKDENDIIVDYDIDCLSSEMPFEFKEENYLGHLLNGDFSLYLENYKTKISRLSYVKDVINSINIDISDIEKTKDFVKLKNFINELYDSYVDGGPIKYMENKKIVVENKKIVVKNHKIIGYKKLLNMYSKSFNKLYEVGQKVAKSATKLGLPCKNAMDRIQMSINEKEILKGSPIIININGETKKFSKISDMLDAIGYKNIGGSSISNIINLDSSYESLFNYYKKMLYDYIDIYLPVLTKERTEPDLSKNTENLAKPLSMEIFSQNNLINLYNIIMKKYEDTPYFDKLNKIKESHSFYNLFNKDENKLDLSLNEFIEFEKNGTIINNKTKKHLPLNELTITEEDIEEKNYDYDNSIISLIAQINSTSEKKEEVEVLENEEMENIDEE